MLSQINTLRTITSCFLDTRVIFCPVYIHIFKVVSFTFAVQFIHIAYIHFVLQLYRSGRVYVLCVLGFDVSDSKHYHHHHHHHPCHIYAWYLQLKTWNQLCFKCICSCSCSIFTICATCNVISPVKYVLYFYISTFRSMCVQCPIWLFFIVVPCYCIFLVCCSGITDFEMVLVVPVFTGIAPVFTFYMRCISVMKSLYFKISAAFLITFLSPGICSVN